MEAAFAETGRRLREVVTEAAARMAEMNEPEVGSRSAPGRWSKKEVLGHLIDSAANNHQRFVRAQQAEELTLPGYEQNFWVEAGGYADAAWPGLVALWREYNLHLAGVIERIPQHFAARRVVIGANEPVTLEFIAADYLHHLEHHLRQILPAPARPERP
jgi:hypothetical protein